MQLLHDNIIRKSVFIPRIHRRFTDCRLLLVSVSKSVLLFFLHMRGFLCQEALKILPVFHPENRIKQFRVTHLHFPVGNILDNKLCPLNGYGIANLIIGLLDSVT